MYTYIERERDVYTRIHIYVYTHAHSMYHAYGSFYFDDALGNRTAKDGNSGCQCCLPPAGGRSYTQIHHIC